MKKHNMATERGKLAGHHNNSQRLGVQLPQEAALRMFHSL